MSDRQAPAARTPLEPVTTGARRSKILLVDDRPDNLMALEAILASLDQELVTAASGEEALKRLLSDDFAVILLDVQMPGMDGFETAHRIKQRGRTRDTPIIFLTAIDREPHHAFRGYAVGAVDYISKPFDPWLLRAKVSVFVDLFEKTERIGELARERGRESSLLAEMAARLSALEVLLGAAEPGTEEQTIAAASAEVRGMVGRLVPLVGLNGSGAGTGSSAAGSSSAGSSSGAGPGGPTGS